MPRVPHLPASHWIITRVHQFKYQICKNVCSNLERSKFEGFFPSTFHRGPKGPLGSPCPVAWPIYWSERRGVGRNGHLGGAGPNWSKVWEGINGQMCPNPTHLMREETAEEGQQESKSGIGQCSMGGKNGSRGTMLQQHRYYIRCCCCQKKHQQLKM